MSESTSFIDQIKERKVIPYFITYLGGCWAIIQLVDWYVERNLFSPYWTQLVFYFLIFLIPAVLVLLFAVSKKEKKKFGRFQLSFMGINLLIAFAFLGFMFKQKPLEKVAEKVVVVNEVGEETERVIPNIEFTKRLLIFPIEAKSGEADQLMRVGVPYLNSIDIEQDATQFVISAITLSDNYRKYNRNIDEKVPFSVQNKIAADLYSDLFITGEYEKIGEKYVVDLKCYTTKDGKELFSETIEGNDIFEICDNISNAYHENLYTKDYRSKTTANFTDFPANSLITNKPASLKSFVKGIIESEFNNNYQGAIQDLEESINLDKNCVECASQLSNLYMAINNGVKSQEFTNLAMKNVETLSERQQLRIKANYYLRNNEMPKAIALFEMWKQLYPNNLEPYSFLIQFLPIFSGPDQAIEVGKEAVEVGHTGTFLLSIANLLANKGDFEEAEEYFNKYQKAFPEKAAEATSLGGIYCKAGRFEDAIKHYEKIELLKPQDSNIKRLIANTESLRGNLSGAASTYEKALVLAQNKQDSVRIYKSMEAYFQKIGQVSKAFEILDTRYTMTRTFAPPIALAVEVFQNQNLHKMYENSGRLPELKERLEAAKPIFNNPGFSKLIDAIYYMITEDISSLDNTIEDVRATILATSGENQLLAMNISYYFAKKDYPQVLSLFDSLEIRMGEINLDQYQTMRALAYKGNGDLEKAKEEYKVHLTRNPHDPQILKEVGELYQDLNESDQAQKYFDEALEILKDADPGYKIKDEILKLVNLPG